jgi:hypothetical protein
MSNEFDDLEAEESISAPTVKEVSHPAEDEDLISRGSKRQLFDWTKSEGKSKLPPRIDLNGKTVTIIKAEIELPPVDQEWEKPFSKTADPNLRMKDCKFIVYYDFERQGEYLSGVKVFKKADGKYSEPAIMNPVEEKKNTQKKE